MSGRYSLSVARPRARAGFDGAEMRLAVHRHPSAAPVIDDEDTAPDTQRSAPSSRAKDRPAPVELDLPVEEQLARYLEGR